MNEKIEDCHKNPRRTGHCDHSTIMQTTAGTYWQATCCWCGRTQQSVITTPEHGHMAPSYKSHS